MANTSIGEAKSFGNDFFIYDWLFLSDDFWLILPDEMWLIQPDANNDFNQMDILRGIVKAYNETLRLYK